MNTRRASSHSHNYDFACGAMRYKLHGNVRPGIQCRGFRDEKIVQHDEIYGKKLQRCNLTKFKVVLVMEGLKVELFDLLEILIAGSFYQLGFPAKYK